MKLPLSTRIARRTLRGSPAARFAVSYEPGLRVPMADGVELVADHYFPDSSRVQDFPTLLVRSPYGRGPKWSALYGMAYAEQGFHVLLQSARGTGGSGGVFQPWRDDGPDGRATIAWLRRQAWFDGRLGLVGPSAVAYAHWALAADRPPELKAMVMQMPIHNPHGFFHRGGIFALKAARLATSTFAVKQHDPGRLLAAAAHPDPADGYWQGTDLLDAADGLTVPTLVISGWTDVALDQALQQFGRLPAGQRSLLIGPWTHTSMFRRGLGRIFAESLAWLRGHLIGPAPPKGEVRVAIGGTTEWRTLSAWPPAALPMSWYLNPDETLTREPPSSPVTETLEERDDVLVCTSPPLTEAIEVLGAVAAEILIHPAAEAPPATLTIQLCDVDERGRTWSVCDGITRVTGPPASTITVAMSSTAFRLLPGHRIRVLISGGAIRPGSAVVLPVA